MGKYRINFGDLEIGPTAKKYIQRAVKRNWISESDNVKEFERSFAEKFGYKYAAATSSGTDADLVACASLYDYGAKRGDEIILPAACFVSCANTILAAGFQPVFVDCDIKTLNIDPDKIEAAVTKKTRAIMVVHTMGKPCEMDTIMKIAKAHKLKVIEDSCEAHGARYKGKIIGSMGDMGTFSFYAAHVIVAGEGGMVVSKDEELDKVIRSTRSHGRPFGSIYFDFERIGFNSRMNELTAAVGIEGVEKFDHTFNTRKDNYYKLIKLLKPLNEYCYFLKEEKHEVLSPHAFSLVLKDKKYNGPKMYKYLESKGIQCKTLFGSLPTQHKAFKFLGHKLGEFPAAEYMGVHGLHFGMHQYLTDDDLVFISDTLKGYFK